MSIEPKIGKNRGNAGKGRPKGSPNKLTTTAKQAIADAFDRLGGTDKLVTWAGENAENYKTFMTQIWPKIIPLQLDGAGDDGQHIVEVRRRIVRPGD